MNLGNITKQLFSSMHLTMKECRSSKRIYELLEGYLRHKSDMVNLEAARAICEMQDASSKELYPAISGKQKKERL